MHELSIAKALLQLAEVHRPAGYRVDRLYVRIGPFQAIDCDSLQWAWQAARSGTAYAAASLDLESLPWSYRCDVCGRQWQAHEMDDACVCGARDITMTGSDELLLLSLDVQGNDETDGSPLGCARGQQN